MWFYKTEDLS